MQIKRGKKNKEFSVDMEGCCSIYGEEELSEKEKISRVLKEVNE